MQLEPVVVDGKEVPGIVSHDPFTGFITANSTAILGGIAVIIIAALGLFAFKRRGAK